MFKALNRAENVPSCAWDEFYVKNVQHDRYFYFFFLPTCCKLRSRRKNMKIGDKVSAFSSCVLEQVRSGTEAAQHLSIIHGSVAGFMLLSTSLVYYISVMLVYSPNVHGVLTSCVAKCVVSVYHYCDRNPSRATCIEMDNSFLLSRKWKHSSSWALANVCYMATLLYDWLRLLLDWFGLQ